jgi:hypothetical protein
MIKGDAQCLNVAAASILAKVSRDRYMDELDKKYPEYGFKNIKAMEPLSISKRSEKYGPIEGVHRKTFRPVSDYYLKQGNAFLGHKTPKNTLLVSGGVFYDRTGSAGLSRPQVQGDWDKMVRGVKPRRLSKPQEADEKARLRFIAPM